MVSYLHSPAGAVLLCCAGFLAGCMLLPFALLSVARLVVAYREAGEDDN